MLNGNSYTATQIAKQIPINERPTTKEIGSWLRSQSVPRIVRRGGHYGGSVWGPTIPSSLHRPLSAKHD